MEREERTGEPVEPVEFITIIQCNNQNSLIKTTHMQIIRDILQRMYYMSTNYEEATKYFTLV